MIPRKILDIGWWDLVVGMGQCLARDKREQVYRACRSCTASPGDAEFFLSVRSGFDALLQALQLPAGSHILVHAITIPDILEIINGNGLVPVPVDLDSETLGIDLESLKSGLREETVGILVTHLFGGRVPMDAVVMFARQHGLLVIEDCAQGYWGDEFSGHPEGDVCMFSFGSIKHNTALGGGLLFIRDAELRRRVNRVHRSYPLQSRWQFFKRVAKYGVLKLLNRQWPYTILCAGARLLGKSPDAIYLATRGFTGNDFFGKIRQQPSFPLLALLLRRLKSVSVERILERRQVAESFRRCIPHICCPGQGGNHAYWLFAIRIVNPEECCQKLLQAGFDALLWPVSLCVVPAVGGMRDLEPRNALLLRRQILFLPVYPEVESHLKELARIVCQCGQSRVE